MAARWSPLASGKDCFWLLCSRGVKRISLFSSLQCVRRFYEQGNLRWITRSCLQRILWHKHKCEVGEGLQRLPLVPCDLQNGGSYFHLAATSPHWPCNGAAQRLDWLPRLKTPFSRSWRRWRSILARHASVHQLVFAYIPLSLVEVSSLWWGSQGTGCMENLQPPDVCWCKLVTNLLEHLLRVLCLTCDWGF